MTRRLLLIAMVGCFTGSCARGGELDRGEASSKPADPAPVGAGGAGEAGAASFGGAGGTQSTGLAGASEGGFGGLGLGGGGATATTGGAGGEATSGGGEGGQPVVGCDASSDCQSCSGCATDANCQPAWDACLSNIHCSWYRTCRGGCATAACIDGCRTLYPLGFEDGDELEGCVCAECPMSCSGSLWGC